VTISKTRGMLCPRSPYVKLAGLAEMLALACPYRLVYEFAPPVRRGKPDRAGAPGVTERAAGFMMNAVAEAAQWRRR